MKIFVRLEAGHYPGVADFEVALPIEGAFVRDALVPLDWPSEDAGIAEMLCSPRATIERVMASRAEISKKLTPILARALMDAMGAKDTEMGYPKK